jgi:hypothetical protein
LANPGKPVEDFAVAILDPARIISGELLTDPRENKYSRTHTDAWQSRRMRNDTF